MDLSEILSNIKKSKDFVDYITRVLQLWGETVEMNFSPGHERSNCCLCFLLIDVKTVFIKC